MTKAKAIKLSPLMIAITMVGVLVASVATTLLFGIFYERAMFETASTSSRQAVSQANSTVSNYISSVKIKLENLCAEVNVCPDEKTLQDMVSVAARLEDDIISVMIYDREGNLLAEGEADGRQLKETYTNLSFNKALFEASGGGYTLMQPHIQTLYQNHYPWVVTIARREYSNLFKQQVYVAIDFNFSEIAKYINQISIGQHGYCYIVDSKNQLVYHPQQQMLFVGVKKEDTDRISSMTDGLHREKDNLYNIDSLSVCNWKIVGVSYNEEIRTSVNRQILIGLLFALLFSLLMSVVVYLVLFRNVSKPVRHLVSEMQRFEKNVERYRYREDEATVEEFQTLSDSFGHMVSMIQSLMERVQNEAVVLRKTELKALQAQINPHFLYNTLDSIQWMCERGNSEDAVKMVGALARLFRISISHGKEFIPLGDELRHAESYLIIQSYRYKNQFTYSFEVEESIRNCMCNKITIQPFIENAIYHGLDRMVDRGEIKISAKSDGKDILIQIADNGLGMTEEQCRQILKKERSDNSGIGVKNVNDRLKIYFGEAYGIQIDSELDVGTTVTVRIPRIEKGRENEY